ncbi:MAG TPA: penicillin-binding transpeptidase domain-containing protein [Candidatus Paceibacterota bacterium]
MFDRLFKRFKGRKEKLKSILVNPDEIFLDSSNIPSFNHDQFEGRIETPIPKTYLVILKSLFLFMVLVFAARGVFLQITKGDYYFTRASTNNLKKEVIFSHRGIIADRNDKLLAWNVESEDNDFDRRSYIDKPGFANVLGFVKYPARDSKGNFYSFSSAGQDGIEKYFDQKLAGENGAKLSEVSVKGEIESQSTLEPPVNGEKINLSIDTDVQSAFYRNIADAVEQSGFVGGTGVIMNAKTGEVLAMVSYPDYDSQLMTEGSDNESIKSILSNKRQPFLDRAVTGLYAPGSIVKAYLALGVLQENIIDPGKFIHTIGYISIPNPYDKDSPSIFKDWKNHGDVDLKRALSVSSDVYFYMVGGGYQGQKGLGILKIEEYMKKFLFGTATEGFFEGPAGTIPSPEWKKKTFDGDIWRIGDTYHTAIGQYGFQVTPLQVARAMTGIANEGIIVSPTIIKNEQGTTTSLIGIDKNNFKIVKEGMRMAVTDGTAIALNISGIDVAGKTGTAELGSAKQRVNSWVEGFFPYEDPKYTFAVVLENGPASYAVSAMQAMGHTLSWITENTDEYVK